MLNHFHYYSYQKLDKKKGNYEFEIKGIRQTQVNWGEHKVWEDQRQCLYGQTEAMRGGVCWYLTDTLQAAYGGHSNAAIFLQS